VFAFLFFCISTLARLFIWPQVSVIPQVNSCQPIEIPTTTTCGCSCKPFNGRYFRRLTRRKEQRSARRKARTSRQSYVFASTFECRRRVQRCAVGVSRQGRFRVPGAQAQFLAFRIRASNCAHSKFEPTPHPTCQANNQARRRRQRRQRRRRVRVRHQTQNAQDQAALENEQLPLRPSPQPSALPLPAFVCASSPSPSTLPLPRFAQQPPLSPSSQQQLDGMPQLVGEDDEDDEDWLEELVGHEEALLQGIISELERHSKRVKFASIDGRDRIKPYQAPPRSESTPELGGGASEKRPIVSTPSRDQPFEPPALRAAAPLLPASMPSQPAPSIPGSQPAGAAPPLVPSSLFSDSHKPLHSQQQLPPKLPQPPLRPPHQASAEPPHASQPAPPPIPSGLFSFGTMGCSSACCSRLCDSCDEPTAPPPSEPPTPQHKPDQPPPSPPSQPPPSSSTWDDLAAAIMLKAGRPDEWSPQEKRYTKESIELWASRSDSVPANAFLLRWDADNKSCRVTCSCGQYADRPAGSGLFFLRNFRDAHLKTRHIWGSSSSTDAQGGQAGSSAESPQPPPTQAPRSAASSSSSLPPLTALQLEDLALLDSMSLTAQQRLKVASLRQECQEKLQGGAAAHLFRVVAKEGRADDFVFECACCNSRTDAGLGSLFLNNAWKNHLDRPVHQRNAAQQLAAFLASQFDVASEAAAQAAQLATVTPAELATMQSIAKKARDAADRATEAACAVEKQLEPRAPKSGSFMPDVLEPSPLQLLVNATPAVELTPASDGKSRIVKCTWCPHTFCGEGKPEQSDSQLLPNIQQHLTSKQHRRSASFGILRHFGQPHTGPSEAPAELIDRSRLCWGYYKRTAEVDGHMIDVSSLMSYQPTEKSVFYQEPHLRYTLKRAAMDPLEIHGTLRSTSCLRVSTDVEGKPLPDAMCDSCRGIFRKEHVRKLAARRAKAAAEGRDGTRMRFDFLSPERRLEIMRSLAKKLEQQRNLNFVLRQVCCHGAPKPISLLCAYHSHHAQTSRRAQRHPARL
jgi:hypothetical protein